MPRGRRGPVALLAVAGTVSNAAFAADVELALEQTELRAIAGQYFGAGVAAGDFDGDGRRELAVGEPEVSHVVYLYATDAGGVDPEPIQTLAGAHHGDCYPDFFGDPLAALDANGDGYDDLAVSATDSSVVYVYQGGPSGLVEESWVCMEEPVTSPQEGVFFGNQLANAGDTDGDGFPELVVDEPYWRSSDGEFDEGALFVYSGGEEGLAATPELQLGIAERSPEGYNLLGAWLAGNVDLNGDGYADLVATCTECGDMSERGGVREGALYWWAGGARGLGGADAVAFSPGWAVAAAPDIDGDGFDDLISSDRSYDGWVHYGSPAGPTSAEPVFVGYEVWDLQGVGDVDGDGLGDLLVAVTLNYGRDPFELYLVFGDAARGGLPDHRKVDQPPEWSDVGYGAGVHRLGDLDGDGRSEFAASAVYAGYDGSTSGKVSVYSPICTWYADQDGDGHGDPTVTTETCHDPGEGWAMRGDDCDDTDPAQWGDTWYLDADGDGYGTRAGETLACAQPPGASSSWHDCDDDDPGISPGAEDATVDGVDQNCDGHDGPWEHDDPSEEEGEEPAVEEEPAAEPDPEMGCFCALGDMAGGAAVVGVLALRRRRRGPYNGSTSCSSSPGFSRIA